MAINNFFITNDTIGTETEITIPHWKNIADAIQVIDTLEDNEARDLFRDGLSHLTTYQNPYSDPLYTLRADPLPSVVPMILSDNTGSDLFHMFLGHYPRVSRGTHFNVPQLSGELTSPTSIGTAQRSPWIMIKHPLTRQQVDDIQPIVNTKIVNGIGKLAMWYADRSFDLPVSNISLARHDRTLLNEWFVISPPDYINPWHQYAY